MKRNWCIIILCLAALFLIGFVNAQDLTPIREGSGGLVNIIVSAFGPFFAALFGGDPDLLFEKILLFFILTSIVYMIVRKMPIFRNNGAIILIVTLSLSLLTTRFFATSSSELIQSVLLPYSVLGVTISAFFPLIIGFFFIHQAVPHSSFMRKSFWIFLLVVFFAMWQDRYSDVGRISWVYFISGVLSFLFFLFDGTIRRAMLRSRYGEQESSMKEEQIWEIDEKIDKLEERYRKNIISKDQYNDKIEKLTEHRRKISRRTY